MDLKDAITAALESLADIQYFEAPDGKVYAEDPNIKDILHLAETLKSKFSIELKDYAITKDEVVDILETVESELIRKGGTNPILRERIKDESKLYEELTNLGNIISRKYSLGTQEETIMKALFMWVGCLTMKKLCRKIDVHGIEPINRSEQHSFLIELSKLNPSVKKGLSSSKIFRINQVTEHPENWDYSWIPKDSPFWCADKTNSNPEKYPVSPQKGMILTDDVTPIPILDFNANRDAVVRMITQSYPKFSIGIYGEWGTGKTTLMKLIETSLKKKGVLTVWFNAWQYEREKQFALIPLLRSIVNEIPNEPQFNGIKKSIRKGTSLIKEHFPKIITSVISDYITKFVGPNTEELVEHISEELIPKIELLNERLERESIYYDGIENIADEVKKLREINPSFKVVVFIDDLDRCSPDKGLEVLESIKLFLGLDGFVYVLGLSHETLSKLIAEKYPGLKGEEYIKKIIQVPIHLPFWDRGDILKLLTNLMVNNIINPKYENIIDEHKILISEIVEPNPRELKRFINNFTATCDVFSYTANKIIPSELLIIQALSIKWNSFYHLLVTSDTRFRQMVFSFANLSREQQNNLDSVDEKILSEDAKIKIKDYKDNYDLWKFIRSNEVILSKILNWEIYRRAIIESEETLQSKIRTEIYFEFRQDKGKFRIEEFDLMAKELTDEFNSNNIHVSSRGFRFNHHTVGLGLIEPYLRITPEQIKRYVDAYKKHGVVKITLKRGNGEPEVIWEQQ